MTKYNRGGLATLQAPMVAPTAQYYTYGEMPPEVWPITNEPPPSKAEKDGDHVLDEQEFAAGGLAQGGLSALDDVAHPSGLTQGPGTGRTDEIDARLSPGEYVLDAETVALIGDGSNEAGARLLDQFREQIRMHKGKALAKGEISPDAKSPLQYLDEVE